MSKIVFSLYPQICDHARLLGCRSEDATTVLRSGAPHQEYHYHHATDAAESECHCHVHKRAVVTGISIPTDHKRQRHEYTRVTVQTRVVAAVS